MKPSIFCMQTNTTVTCCEAFTVTEFGKTPSWQPFQVVQAYQCFRNWQCLHHQGC